MGEFFRRLRYLLNRRRFDEELESDMEFHREMAAREGRMNFGNTLRLREDAREAWGWTWIDRLGQDLHYAARILTRSPGFTVTAVLVLAIGIGINVTAFSLFNMLILKPLPVRDPDTIVRLQRRSPEMSSSEMPYPSVVFYREHAKTLSAVMATMGAPPMGLESDTQPVRNIFVTSNYFAELGVPAAFGRLLDPVREEAPDAPPVVVLSYGFWQRRFGSDSSIIGKTIHLNKKPATVIGVTSYSFAGLDGQNSDIWLPLMQQPYFVENSNTLTNTTTGGETRMWGRLAHGVTAKMAEQELLSLTNELRKQYPKLIWDKEFIKSDPGGHSLVMQPEMYPVFTMVGTLTLLILAVACANLGGLMLARGVTREHEIGIRVAIGASKKRIFRQLFTESLLLALLGLIAGLAMCYATLRAGMALMEAPAWMSAAPDWRVLVFTIGVTLVATLFFGLIPALQITRQRQRKMIARQVLVGAQITASCVLLIAAGLLVRAVQHILHSDPGFGYEQSLAINPGLDHHGYTPAAARTYLDELKSRLRAIPGVTSVSLSRLPVLGHGWVSRISTEIDGHPINIYPNWVDPAFFQTMDIPLIRGRNLLPGEANAVIVSESLARKQWPAQDPIGKLLWNNQTSKDTVVGVAGNARLNAMNDTDAAEAYWAAQPADMAGMTVIVKTAGAPEGLIPMLKSTTENLDPKLFPDIWLLKSGFRQNTWDLERIMMTASLMGIVAMLLAVVGIVGLIAYAVSQRTKELAIRIALGARRIQVLSTVLRQFLLPVVFGLMAGIGIAAGLSKTLRKALYGISNLDPLSYAGAIAMLVAIIGLAALLPLRRALHLNLAKTLHYE